MFWPLGSNYHLEKKFNPVISIENRALLLFGRGSYLSKIDLATNIFLFRVLIKSLLDLNKKIPTEDQISSILSI